MTGSLRVVYDFFNRKEQLLLLGQVVVLPVHLFPSPSAVSCLLSLHSIRQVSVFTIPCCGNDTTWHGSR